MLTHRNIAKGLLFYFFFALGTPAWANADRSDFDLDDDGLIEINSIADLKAIGEDISRFSHSKKLYGKNTGCPLPYCVGYELSTNLDFDLDGDGELSFEEKNYRPISFFSGVFEGNNFSILNLHSEELSDYPGIFYRLRYALIRNLNIGGDLMFIRGASASGALASIVDDSYILNVQADTHVESGVNAGGLIGHAGNSVIFNSHVRGSVTGYNGNPDGATNMGGIVGTISNTQIIASSFVGHIAAQGAWGFAQPGQDNSLILNSYALLDKESAPVSERTNLSFATTTKRFSFVLSETDNQATVYNDTSLDSNNVVMNATKSLLSCANNSEQVECEQDILQGWNQQYDAAGKGIWVFGNDEDLPHLNSSLTFDEDSMDIDKDGYSSAVDAFPFDDRYYLDTDNNLVPDDCEMPCSYLTPNSENNTGDVNKSSAGSTNALMLWLLGLLFAVRFILNKPNALSPWLLRH